MGFLEIEESKTARKNLKQKSLADDLMIDHSTFWRFRKILVKENILETLLDEINTQLANQGLLIRTGEVNIIDASVIETKRH